MPRRTDLADRLAVLRVAGTCAAAWCDPAARSRALAAVRAVAGADAGDTLAVASHLAEDAARDVVLHRPWMLERAPVRGRSCWTARTQPAAASWSATATSAPSRSSARPSRPGCRALLDAAGVRLVNAESGGGARIRELLGAGEVVSMTYAPLAPGPRGDRHRTPARSPRLPRLARPARADRGDPQRLDRGPSRRARGPATPRRVGGPGDR